jgi:primase-polymerase (primpol)-like protein
MNKKPEIYNGDLSKLPSALKPLTELPHWVVWRLELNEGKWTKVPYQPRHPHKLAKNNDPSTWASYEEALEVYNDNPSFDGIGFNLLNSGYGGIDLDKCYDFASKETRPWAESILALAEDTYAEVTVSGTGLRVIGRITGTKKGREIDAPDGEEGHFELYRGKPRYITISGNALNGSGEGDLSDITALLDELAAEHPAVGEGKPGRPKGSKNKPKLDLPANIMSILE